ncbi:MAG: PilZ domain-containing protein [Acidobacteria bacterium]|nr:PilZ domain-containing protein [Acidobacteriota bacterium]
MDEKMLTYHAAIGHLDRIVMEIQSGSLHMADMRQRAEDLAKIARFLKSHFEQQRASIQMAAFNLVSPSGTSAAHLPGAASLSRRQAAEDGEKRRHRRVGLILSVEMTIEGYNISGRITDLSEGGFFVDTLTIFGVGTPVEFSFSVDGQKVEGKGIVRASVEQFGMGVEIVEIPDADLDHLSDYLKKQE